MLLREREDGMVDLVVSLSQLKTIYGSLFRQLHGSSAEAIEALDEDDMLLTLQSYLQKRARQDGVDATQHAEWAEFLGFENGPKCAVHRPPDPTD